MANQIAVNVYQINSLDPIPLGNVQKNLFPSAGFFGRPIINPQTGVAGLLLSTGVYVYTQLQLLATGAVYSVAETPTAIQQMANS